MALSRTLALLGLGILTACAAADVDPESPADSSERREDEATATAKAAGGGGGTTGTLNGNAASGLVEGASGPVESPADPELSPARRIAAKLGRPSQFLVGLGHDAADLGDANKMHAYELPAKVDIHYMYLSNFEWPTWKPNGTYIDQHAAAAKARGITPMFTLYQAAVSGDGNIAAFNETAYMTKYWAGVRLMYERLAAFDAPAIVHLEPDLWGYAQKKNGDDPASTPVRVKALVAECKDLTDDVSGLARCMIRLGRSISPKVLIGLSASSFGAPDPARVGKFLTAIGAAHTDLMVVETLDRDAGCFEEAIDPNCKRNGSFYWDENNVQHPNFHDHLAWTKTINEVTGLPLLWWQMPLGRPNAAPGGEPNKYRDNRVKYFFNHPEEFAAAGGVGAVFGKGKANQTTVKTDGGQFAEALKGYRAKAPLLLQ